MIWPLNNIWNNKSVFSATILAIFNSFNDPQEYVKYDIKQKNKLFVEYILVMIC